MKRSRDDGFASSQLKRPSISPPAEPSGQAQMSTASSMQRLTTNDALSYLKTVKEIFLDKKDKYDEFLDVMKDFKAQRIDTSGVIYRVKELFKGNRDLILGFNAFLPKGFEITLTPEDEFLKKKPVEFEEAISFVNKIKTRFQGDDHVYKAFLDILNMYRRDNKSITEVYQEVSVLFQQHADLLVEFTHFLPDTSGTASIQYPPHGRNPTRHGIDRGSPMTTARPTHVDKKPAVLCGVYDQYHNHHNPEQLNHVEKVIDKREDDEKLDWEHADNLDNKRKSAIRDDFGADRFHQGNQNPEFSFLEKVKERIHDPETCNKISDCIRSYKSKFVAASQFRILVGSLLGSHPDLMDACEDFITYIERIGSMRSNKHVIKSLKTDGDGADHDRVDRDRNRDHDNGDRDRHDRGIAFNTRDALGQKVSPYASREKYIMKPIQELDLSNCESCTPSYRLLPEHYPIPPASCRTDIGAKVLNDRWVSVTSGSEDYSFKHMRKNQYEESLFRCEDDRFELDMLLESVNTTVKRVEELLNSLNAHSNRAESSYCIEDHLTALNLRCIERLYGDHGLDVMDVLRKNAALSLPVILTRLKQKQEEWAQCRADFNKVWADIYAKNYHKSLDHRSFYFKQQDVRNLSAKALLSEIREISEKSQSEDEKALTISGGYKQHLRPQMEFEYPDPEIQEDLSQLVKYSCEEICSPEQHDRVMKVWMNYLEPVFGISSHHQGAEDKESASIADSSMAKSLENNGENNLNPTDQITSPKPSNEPSGTTQVTVGNGHVEVKNDHSPAADNAASKSDILNSTPQNGSTQTDANMLSSTSWVNKEAGLLEEGNPSTAREKSPREQTAQKGLDSGSADQGLEASSTQESQPQDGVITKPTASSTGMVPDVAATQCDKEIEPPSKIEGEEGELSPNRNLEDEKAANLDNTGNKEEGTRENSASTRDVTGEATCAVTDETVANADDGEESVRDSSDTENASENGDASASESANGEECSPDEPDDDEDHEGNDKKVQNQDVEDGLADEGMMLHSDHSILSAKPISIKISTPSPAGNEKNSHIFYGNDSFYLLFRLHRILYERMRSAKLHSLSPENKWRILNDANLNDPYARFKDALNNLLNGSSDNAKFEDDCRAIVGAQSYVLFTLDKLIQKLFKQLQKIATEDLENKLLQLYAYEKSRNPESFSDVVYRENAHLLLPDDNLYRFEFFPSSISHLTIQLMKRKADRLEPTSAFMDPNFAAYLNDELLAVVPERSGKPGIFLKRNRRNISTEDENCGMEGLVIQNGVEIKIKSHTMKAAYVLGTEDLLYRISSRKRSCNEDGGDAKEIPSKRRKLMFN